MSLCSMDVWVETCRGPGVTAAHRPHRARSFTGNRNGALSIDTSGGLLVRDSNFTNNVQTYYATGLYVDESSGTYAPAPYLAAARARACGCTGSGSLMGMRRRVCRSHGVRILTPDHWNVTSITTQCLPCCGRRRRRGRDPDRQGSSGADGEPICEQLLAARRRRR